MKILTVDDSRIIRRILRGMIETLGYEPVEADCGTAAIELLGNDGAGVALVLLDWNMPGMNGLEVLEAIKGDDGLSGSRSSMMKRC
ncbi:MAG: response regulator [Thermodesulfobacteriota bacterium]